MCRQDQSGPSRAASPSTDGCTFSPARNGSDRGSDSSSYADLGSVFALGGVSFAGDGARLDGHVTAADANPRQADRKGSDTFDAAAGIGFDHAPFYLGATGRHGLAFDHDGLGQSSGERVTGLRALGRKRGFGSNPDRRARGDGHRWRLLRQREIRFRRC